MDTQHIKKSEEILGKIALEISLTSTGSDEGLIPVYSLLGDLESIWSENEILTDAVVGVQIGLEKLLDDAMPFDMHHIEWVGEFVEWGTAALYKIKNSELPRNFSFTRANEDQEEDTLDVNSFAAYQGEDEDETENDEVSTESKQSTVGNTVTIDTVDPRDALMEMNLGEDDELISEFHSEALDHLEQIEASVLVLEESPEDQEHLNAVFRSFHTLKGVAGFLNLKPIQSLAHEVEHLLDRARNHDFLLNSEMITLILQSRDRIQELVAQVTEAIENGKTPEEIIPVAILIDRVHDICERALAGDLATNTNTDKTQIDSAESTAEESEVEVININGGFFPSEGETFAEAIQKSNTPTGGDTSGGGATTLVAAKKKSTGKKNTFNGDHATIRVNTTKLDNLMDMVGELVIIQSQLRESSQTEMAGNSPLQRNLSQLTRITKELQHNSMALRMVPIKPTFQKLGRLVRDLARKFEKEVAFITKGEETELDRNVIEQIGDPLMHMVRNAIDHGLENTEARVAAGKSSQGKIHISAYHAGGNIVIELTDDGKGLNWERILEKARSQNLIELNQEISRQEIYQLIFQPGFSTAQKVTDISGRGVGMDVVRRNIEKIRGTVEVQSETGKGTTFKIKLPLTMAIIDGLVVRVGSDKFILPTTSVKVAVKPKTKEISKIQGRLEVIDFRGASIPVVKLGEKFGLLDCTSKIEDGIVVIIETFGKTYGLLVDEMTAKQEVVIKNLGNFLGKIKGVAGGAILGDGSIALILDPFSLLQES